jgi:uncharacterized 2Fe-2S/4Fe-4S cluster protein (DUF4445 family)
MTASQDPLVVFTPSGKRGRFPVGTPLLSAARTLGVDVDSVCGGRGICGRCQVLIAEGEFAKHGVRSGAASVSAVSEVETRYAKRRGLAQGHRLSCQSRVERDVVVDVPPGSQVHRQVVRKDADAREIELNPVVRLHYVEVREPDMQDPSGDLRRLFEALEREWGLKDLACDPSLLGGLQALLRKGEWKVTAAVHGKSQVIALWPGFHDKAFGMAVDVGSTTVAAHLCNLESGELAAAAGVMNPQIRFGEDLMSRVSYAMMNPGGAAKMTEAIREALSALAAELAREAGIELTDILELALVGNPIMHHLVLGIDRSSSAGALRARGRPGADSAGILARNCGEPASACLRPALHRRTRRRRRRRRDLAERPDQGDEITLLVDVGTNAEIVLGNRERLLACSSPTGPAFEGAQISCGQRAAPGAIERVRIDPATLDPRYKVIGSDLWSDDPGFDAATARTGVTGVCGSGIIEVIAGMYLAGVINQDGVIDGALATRSDRIVADGRTFSYVLHRGAVPMKITQTDVRAIQLAKAALYAGVALLMDISASSAWIASASPAPSAATST